MPAWPLAFRISIVGRNQYGYITPAFLGPHAGEEAIWFHNACLLAVLMVEKNQYGYITPAHGGKESIRLDSPWPFRVPLVGRNQCGYITPAFVGPQWWGGVTMVA